MPVLKFPRKPERKQVTRIGGRPSSTPPDEQVRRERLSWLLDRSVGQPLGPGRNDNPNPSRK